MALTLRQSAFSAIFRGAATAASQTVEPKAQALPETLEGLAWKDVERLIVKTYHRDGFFVNPVSDDLCPVDFIIQRGDERLFVQCRNWNVWEVPDKAVRELAGYMSGAGVSQGFMLTTGQYTDQARAFASARGLELVDGASLPQLLTAA
jgi:restriction system protein